jgi:hypothetical protein
VRLVLISGGDPTGQLPFGKTIQRRVQQLEKALVQSCADSGVTLISVFADAELRAPRYWSGDRLHLNTTGHERAAGLVLHGLGYGPVPAPAPQTGAAKRSVAANARYYQQHVLPWIQRRLRGKSSGDLRDPKHPAWHRIDPATPAEHGTLGG